MQKLITALFVVVAIIHILPLSGVVGVSRLAVLYGLNVDEPNLQILMRHRAILFGILGFFILWAAFTPSWQSMALIAGFISVVSFILLAFLVGDYNAELNRVLLADYIALACLAGVVVIKYLLIPRPV